MELILAEKPSAARNFAKALGGKTGSYAGTEYKITNLRGHVMGLLPPDRQVPADKADFYKSWELENLPWDLDDFAWKKGILSGCKDIISGLKDELKGADCVVIATDVDPSGEGELLAWEALEKCGWRGPTKRMYFADEAPASVQKAFRERKTLPSMDKDGDYVKAVVRERWDLASMQFTRAATLVARKKGFRTVVRQGRLKSVMVKLTGDQLKAYNEYVRKPFYEARFKDKNGNIFARKTDDPEDIRFDSPDKVDLSQLHDSAVAEDSRAKKHTAPGKLLDLAGLSAILAKQGFKPANVLKTYQEMYENQIVSYPRTEDKEVTPEQFGELLPLVDKIASVVGVDTSLLSHRAARKTHAIIIRDIDFLMLWILQVVEMEKVPNLSFRLRQGNPCIVKAALVVVTVISDAHIQAFCEILFHGYPFYSINRRAVFVRFYHFPPISISVGLISTHTAKERKTRNNLALLDQD